MPVLTIGSTEIPYTLKHSGTCDHARITVTPDGVEVIVPPDASDDDITQAIHRRRQWIFEQTRKMQNLASQMPRVARFVNGAKIPYRGRMIRLKVVPTDDNLTHVRYENGFIIEHPADKSEASQDTLIEDALRLWLRKRLRQDVASFVSRYGKAYDLKPRDFRIKDQKHMWGSCGQDRIININWHLIFAPKTVLEYAVVHELCHLRHRNHDEPFWSLVRSILPDYERRKLWLDKNEHLLGMTKIDPEL